MKFDDALCGYSPLTEERIKHVWEQGVFCLDANVLLDVYRYSEEGRPAFLQILQRLKYRLFVPARVAVEFARNRPKVISGHFEPNQMMRRKLNEMTDALNSRHKDHPDRDELLATLERMRDVERSSFGERETRQMALLSRDPILEQFMVIVGTEVGDPYPDDELKKDYDRRQELKTPPFCVKDHGKGESVDETYGPDERTGDVAIWLEALAFCEAKKSPLIFVTGDMKENWWRHAGERDVPQPALVQEFRKRIGHDVLFYRSERFLEAVPLQLGGEQSKKLVEEAKELERRDRQRDILGPFAVGHSPLDRLTEQDAEIRELRRKAEIRQAQMYLEYLASEAASPEGLASVLSAIEKSSLTEKDKKGMVHLSQLVSRQEGLKMMSDLIASYPGSTPPQPIDWSESIEP